MAFGNVGRMHLFGNGGCAGLLIADVDADKSAGCVGLRLALAMRHIGVVVGRGRLRHVGAAIEGGGFCRRFVGLGFDNQGFFK